MVKISGALFNNRQIVIIIFIIFFAFFLYGSRSFIYSWLYDHKLVPIAETFTELYFDDHNDLPSSIREGEVTSFSFVIHNLEGRQMEYVYRVSYKNNSNSETEPFFEELLSDKVVLEDKALVSIPVIVSLYHQAEKGIIYVDILNKNQSIHFLINN